MRGRTLALAHRSHRSPQRGRPLRSSRRPSTSRLGWRGVSDGFVGAVGFHIDQEGITELERVSHPTTNGNAPPISRSIVIGDLLYTLSDEGILASSLDALAPIAFASFPAPPRTAPPPARRSLRPRRAPLLGGPLDSAGVGRRRGAASPSSGGRVHRVGRETVGREQECASASEPISSAHRLVRPRPGRIGCPRSLAEPHWICTS